MVNSAFCIVGTLLLVQCLGGCSKGMNRADRQEVLIETEPPVLKPVLQKVNDFIGGYYHAIPARYDENIAAGYPLLLFIHGGGQFGNGSYDLPLLLNEGIPQLLDEKKFPARFEVNDIQHSFIVLIPQFNRVPDNSVISSFLDHAKKNYRIDTTRMYICGFSLGARIACDFSAEFADRLAAIVPISGVSNFLVNEKTKSIAKANLPVWAFHNQPDALFSAKDTREFMSQVSAFNPVILPRLTLFPDSTGILGHDAWSKATDPAYKENNMNIYEWMLRFKR
ncbi:MAG TPA: dienelactone hydrolase family protein [Chitinophagaceae bacterium]